MFSKIKKVLVSLALASSLALAPMNVSAAGTLTQDSSNATTSANYRAIDHAYSVEIPDSVDFTSDDLEEPINIEVKDSLVGHKIKVTPSFTPNTGVAATIAFTGGSVTIEGKNSSSITATLTPTGLAADDYVTSTEIGKIGYVVEPIEIT